MKRIAFAVIVMVLAGCGPQVPDFEVFDNDPALSRDREGHLYFKGQLFSGYLTTWYAEGSLKTKDSYCKGVLEADSYGFYPNGDTAYVRPYVGGEKHGEHIGYFPGGAVKFHYHFDRGKSVGNHREWYQDGQLASDLNYVNGHPFGLQRVWRPDGKIRSNYVIREDGRRYGLIGIKRCKNIDTELEQITRLTSAIYDK